MIVVLAPGLLTTVQDFGRPGWRAAGVPAGGAMDPWAARAANRLVGNPDGAALLEATLAGPVVRFERAAAVAWVAGDMEAAIDGAPAAGERMHRLAAGATLALGRARRGARCWLAVAGGIDVPELLGSRSTDLAGRFGGLEGRPLAAGDRLPVGGAAESPPRALEPGFARSLGVPRFGLVPGPDGSAEAIEELVAGEWLVAARSDRRGVRVERPGGGGGSRWERPGGGELRSQGTLPGAVQRPPSGEAILLGVDAPVTGGYPWVAQIAAAEVGRLAHLPPGARLRFEVIDFEEADRRWARRERELELGVLG